MLESLSRSHAALSQELLQTAPGGSRDAYAGAAGEAGGSEASDSVAGRISLAGGTGVQEGQEEGEGAGQRRGEERVGEEGWEEASLAGEMSAAVVAPEAEAGVDGDAGADEQQEQDQDQEQEQHGDEVQEEGEDVDATARWVWCGGEGVCVEGLAGTLVYILGVEPRDRGCIQQALPCQAPPTAAAVCIRASACVIVIWLFHSFRLACSLHEHP